METMMNSVLLIKPERKQWIPLPHYLLINGQMLGLMRGNDSVRVALPAGDYGVTIRSAYKFIESMGHGLRGGKQRLLRPLAPAYLDHSQALFPDKMLTDKKTISPLLAHRINTVYGEASSSGSC